MSEKPCTKCKETKPFTEFYPAHRRKNGLESQCKKCMKAGVIESKNRLNNKAYFPTPRIDMNLCKAFLRGVS